MKNQFRTFFLFFLILTFGVLSGQTIIAIDAGHGGKDYGGRYHTTFEKDINRDIVDYIISMNTNENVKFVRVREEDEFLELNKRVSIINEIQPDLVLSVHLNASADENQNGIMICYSRENGEVEKSKEMAEKLKINLENLPLKMADVQNLKSRLLEQSKNPAITVNIGYLTNEKDREYVSTVYGQKEIARAILEFTKVL